MRLPVVAVVGRPNVGKSTLFNRLAGRRISIVEDIPGVTRDRLYADAEHEGVRFTLIDTGGFEADPKTMISSAIREQTQLAIEEADVVLFVTDVRTGTVPGDGEVAMMLRKSNRPLVLAANKSDSPKQEGDAAAFYELGLGDMVAISAEHGRNIGEMLDAVVAAMPEDIREAGRLAQEHEDQLEAANNERVTYAMDEAEAAYEAEHEGGEPVAPTPRAKAKVLLPEVLRIAVIGKPNAGKSSLVNKLLGEDRHLVSDMPGTTVDAVDSFIDYGGFRFRLIDTAGIRKKRSISMQMEKYAVVAALKGMDRADVALFLIDATIGLTEQDMKVAAFAHDKGKGIVICVNKWDLRKAEGLDADTFRAHLRERMPFLDYAPIMFVSALTGRRVFDVLERAADVAQECFTRVPTGEVNRVIQAAVRAHPPPMYKNKKMKLFFGAQVTVAPPTFVIATNEPSGVHFSYRRFMLNRFRDHFGFEGSPIRMIYRQRGSAKGREKNLEARKRALAREKRNVPGRRR